MGKGNPSGIGVMPIEFGSGGLGLDRIINEFKLNIDARKVQAQVRERVLRLFKRRALLSPETVDAMREWGHEGGCS